MPHWICTTQLSVQSEPVKIVEPICEHDFVVLVGVHQMRVEHVLQMLVLVERGGWQVHVSLEPVQVR